MCVCVYSHLPPGGTKFACFKPPARLLCRGGYALILPVASETGVVRAARLLIGCADVGELLERVLQLQGLCGVNAGHTQLLRLYP